ncbi:MAG: GNAT family N-acetyltransferase [Ruminococcus sp.]|nr:GNAT family N-acetyltransferase [Ruminococcus sp.]
MEIYEMSVGHEKWGDTADFAEKCGWSAGKVLAEKMRSGDFKGLERVFMAYEDRKPVGFCTFTERDCLSPKYLYKPFIGSVFVAKEYRGQRISEQMIETVRHYARINGYGRVYVMSGEKGLYEKFGFTKIGNYETTHGTVEQLFVIAS